MISNKITISLMALFILGFGPPAQAEFKSFFGLDLGADKLITNNTELDKNGFDLGVKFGGYWQSKNWILSPAIGFQFESLSAEDVEMQTSSPFAELGLRYRFTNRLSFGPVTQLQVGKDQSRSEIGSDSNLMWNAGAQMVYDLIPQRDSMKLELGAFKSLSGLEGRDLYSVKVGLIILFGSEEKKVNSPVRLLRKTVFVVVQKPKVIPRIPILVVPGLVKKEIFIREDNEDLKVVLNSDVIGFKFDSYELDDKSKNKLTNLGKYLVANNISMGKIRISGYTDNRGTREYNLELSNKRSDVVKQVLLDSGVTTPLLSYGYGKSRPLDDRDELDAWAKNRRTEIEFINVVEKKGLINAINHIMTDP